MKKFLGITFGGLQRKALVLVLLVLVLTVSLFAAVSLYQNRQLVEIVDETRTEQQTAISEITSGTMHQMVDGSLTESTELQASLVDNDFSEVIRNIYMLQSIAEGLLENSDLLEPQEVSLPQAELDGVSSAFVLCEEDVDYTRSRWLGILSHMSAPMIAMQSNSEKIDSCYIGLSDGTFLCVDEKSGLKLDGSGQPIPFAVRQRPWYTGAIEADGLYFTDLIDDAFSGKCLITCSIPVRCGGETVGVAGLDIVLESMTDFVSSNFEGTWSYVMNGNGQIILGSEGGIFQDVMDARTDLRAAGIPGLSEVLDLAQEQNTGLQTVTLDGMEYYLVCAPVPSVGWTVLNVVEKQMTEQSERELLGAYDSINEAATARFREEAAGTTRQAAVMLAVVVVLSLLMAYASTKHMVKPIEEMTREIRSRGMSGKPFEVKAAYRTNDEIELLAESFADLSRKAKTYIEEIRQVTAEKERIGAELELAKAIQEGMLPHVFPPFPERRDIELYASMNPAREVGGDFYDYFLIDSDHLGMVMADVSGKGIPAALFMMASKIILQSVAMLGRSPAEVLTKTNEAICSSNQAEMFVTVWFGILELSTGKLTAANAGHEYPVFKQPDGSFALYKDKHGLVLGGMDGTRYREYELVLEPGTKLFLYTDGVTEATNRENGLFGVQRMLEALNREPDAGPEQLLENVHASVDDFADGAEQFDDITMLCLEYRGNAEINAPETSE